MEQTIKGAKYKEKFLYMDCKEKKGKELLWNNDHTTNWFKKLTIDETMGHSIDHRGHYRLVCIPNYRLVYKLN